MLLVSFLNFTENVVNITVAACFGDLMQKKLSRRSSWWRHKLLWFWECRVVAQFDSADWNKLAHSLLFLQDLFCSQLVCLSCSFWPKLVTSPFPCSCGRSSELTCSGWPGLISPSNKEWTPDGTSDTQAVLSILLKNHKASEVFPNLNNTRFLLNTCFVFYSSCYCVKPCSSYVYLKY